MLITSDRLVSVTRPFNKRQLSLRRATLLVSVLWLLAAVVAALPLCVETEDYFGLEFYGGNGVCLPFHVQDPFADVSNQRLRVFENKLLRTVFQPKGEEVTGACRRLLNEELLNLYPSPNIIRVIKSKRIKYAGHVAPIGEMRNAYKILAGKPKGKKSLGRPSRRWEDTNQNLAQSVSMLFGLNWGGFL
jgi:hypothetical protein